MPNPQLRILVPMQRPNEEIGAVRLAAALAAAPWGEVHLTHVVTPDSNSPDDVEQQLAAAAQVAADLGVGAIPHVERGEDLVHSIEAAIARWNCNMMVMGWYREVHRDAILAAANRDLAKKLSIDTLIFKDRGFRPARRILAPTAGGGHSMIGLQIASDLARRWGSELDIVRVARDARCEPDDPVLSRYCEQLRDDTRLQLELLGIDAPFDILAARDVIEPIVDRAARSDLVILGATNDWRQEEYLAGSIPDDIARRVKCSVLMVRTAQSGRESLSSVLWENTVRLGMAPVDKWDAITQLVDALVEEKQIPVTERDNVLAAALRREHQSPTGMGHETAIPHAPIPNLPGLIGALGICPQGVDFAGPQDGLVRFVFLLLTPKENYRSYIPVLSEIASFMRVDRTRQALLQCLTPAEVTALIKAQGP